jgi:hypothetical protein
MSKLDGAKTIAKGAAKVSYGLVRGGLAAAVATGHGFTGKYLRKIGAPNLASYLANKGFKEAEKALTEGTRDIKSGIRDWNRKS